MSNNIDQVLSQIRAVRQLNPELQANKAIVNDKPNGLNQSEKLSGPSFNQVLKQGIDAVNEQQQLSGKMTSDFELGHGDKSLAEVMVQVQKADVSFKAMTAVRNKLVESYREIMQMSV